MDEHGKSVIQVRRMEREIAMRVIVAAVSSNRSMSGVSRHAANLAKGLLGQKEIAAVHVLVGEWEHKYVSEAIGRQDAKLHLHTIPLKPGALCRNLWYYRTLPAIARQLHADVVHLAYPSPIKPGTFHCPVVTSLHDLYPYDIPSNFGFPKVLFNRMILKQCLKTADAIACVSNSTKLQLGVRLPRMLPKAVTVQNCVEAAPIALKPSFAIRWADRPFLLCVAQHRRNKNIPVAMRAFHHLLQRGAIEPDARLVLIGLQGPETGRIEETIRELGLTQRVVLASGISDAEMNWCYRNCSLLLAPSIVEGFGLPVAEGRVAGCRIVCSDIPAFREVGDAACRFVELGTTAEADFAIAAEAILGERKPLPAKLSHLTPAAVARQYVRLYRMLVDSRKAFRASVMNENAWQDKGQSMETKAAV